MSNWESKIVKNRSDQKKNSNLWRICVGNFFRLSSFFSVALTVSLGLLSWLSVCCLCSAPKRRLRWQKGGSGQGHVSQCWPRMWGVQHAGIFFLLLSCDGFTIPPYLFSRVSFFFCTFAVFICLHYRFMCNLSSRVLSFVCLLASRCNLITSLACLPPSPFAIPSSLLCLFSPVSSVVCLSCCVLFLLFHLFCVSFNLLLSSCTLYLFTRVSSLLCLS